MSCWGKGLIWAVDARGEGQLSGAMDTTDHGSL